MLNKQVCDMFRHCAYLFAIVHSPETTEMEICTGTYNNQISLLYICIKRLNDTNVQAGIYMIRYTVLCKKNHDCCLH